MVSGCLVAGVTSPTGRADALVLVTTRACVSLCVGAGVMKPLPRGHAHQGQCSFGVALYKDPQDPHGADERSASEAMEAVRENLTLLHPIHLTAVNVQECINEVLKRIGLPTGIKVSTTGIRELPPVKAGYHSLALVLTNLLENAIEEMAGQGEIAIRGRLKGSGAHALVEIAVSDNGPGIPAHLQESVFQFNFSGRAASRPHKLGFGLWWVKTVMARLGGSVDLKSDGQQGATFFLRLPRVEEF